MINKGTGEKRCNLCGKLLIANKTVCRRCQLELRDNSFKACVSSATVVKTAVSAAKLVVEANKSGSNVNKD